MHFVLGYKQNADVQFRDGLALPDHEIIVLFCVEQNNDAAPN
jgi:hypothetical protein